MHHTGAVNSGAAAPQSGSNLTLYVAIIGILGTLAAAVIAQWMTGRREKKRWKRESEQEAIRWEREREERREQWQREDAARLHERRVAAYSELIVTMRDAIMTAQLARANSYSLDNLASARE